MKKIKKLFFIMLFFIILSFDDVKAIQYEIGDLIPIDEMAVSVVTDNFEYNNFSYNDNSITFSSIKNLSDKKIPVSISIGFFDSEKKNVGIINYCSTEEYDSDYSGFELSSQESTNFSIQVKDKYFNAPEDKEKIVYMGIIDDNQYCKIGGATNYIGKTMEQIHNKESIEATNANIIEDFMKFIGVGVIVFVLVGLIMYIVQGVLLNYLHIRMYKKSTPLAWLPICNNYLCIKLTFGKPIAIIYILVSCFCGVLGTKVAIVTSIIISIFYFIAFVLVIVKFITKNYDWVIFNKKELPRDNFAVEKTIFEKSEQDYSNRDNSLIYSEQASLLDDESDSTGSFQAHGTVVNSQFIDVNMINNNHIDNSNEDVKEDSSDLSNFYK